MLALMHPSQSIKAQTVVMINNTHVTCTQDTPAISHQSKISSRYRGLCWDRKHKAWRVRIVYDGKQRHVGRYKDETVAARAYDKAALFLYGGKAILNFTMEECLADTSEVCSFIFQAKEPFELAASADQIGVQQAPQGRPPGLLPASQLNISNQQFRSTEWCRCSTLHQQVSGQCLSHTPAGGAPLVGDAQQLRYPTSSHSLQLTHSLAACSSAQCPPTGQYLLAQVGPQAAPVPSAACQEQPAIAGAAPLQAPPAALAASSASCVSYCHTSQAAAGSCCSSWSMLSPGSVWTVNSHGREHNSSSSCLLPYSPSISANPHHHTASKSPARHLPGQYQPLLPSQDAMQLALPPVLAAPPPLLLREVVAGSASSYSMLSRNGSILDPRAPLLLVHQPAGGQRVLPGPAWQKQTVPGVSSACTVSASSCSISLNTAELQHITGQSAGLCELAVGAMGLGQQLLLGDGSLLWTGPPPPGSHSLCGGPLVVPQWQQQGPEVVVSSTPGFLADAQSALHIAPHVNHLQA